MSWTENEKARGSESYRGRKQERKTQRGHKRYRHLAEQGYDEEIRRVFGEKKRCNINVSLQGSQFSERGGGWLPCRGLGISGPELGQRYVGQRRLFYVTGLFFAGRVSLLVVSK